MADLLSILSQGASSLDAHRASTATASHNLQNVDTPGYSRQSVMLEAVIPATSTTNAYIGRGVRVETIRQARDRFVESQIPSAIGSAARASSEAQSLSTVHVLNPDMAGGLTSALADFFSGLRALSQNPGSTVLRQNAVDGARGLASSFNRTADGITSARTAIDQEIEGAIHEVNDLATRMAALNVEIRKARSTGAEPNDLLDTRAKLRDQLAEKTGAIPVPNSQGDISMTIENGMALVSETSAGQLSIVPDPANDGFLKVGISLSDGTGPFSLSSLGGKIGGLLNARDGALKNAANAVDRLAFDMAEELNAVHSSAYALDKSSGHNLFQVGSDPHQAAKNLTVNPQVSANPDLIATASSADTVPGDASRLFALIDVENAPLAGSGGKDATATLSQIISGYGTAVQRAEAYKENSESIRDHLLNMRESVSGVSIDEEIVNMTRAQRAFEAVAKVITTTNEMLETLMKLK